MNAERRFKRVPLDEMDEWLRALVREELAALFRRARSRASEEGAGLVLGDLYFGLLLESLFLEALREREPTD